MALHEDLLHSRAPYLVRNNDIVSEVQEFSKKLRDCAHNLGVVDHLPPGFETMSAEVPSD
ncbi:hypothetical protein QBC46DRAFT_338485 [Diplogelasinospora grovesii]|uniref:Uncharacterized protein n=1 Tax=Diplogelasinospora grovesii TaxID=303347 RepID=A0AAN6S7Q4_9PEZI|nr:hypothetical protein QBC46DRAFT_338485 [Diplogelasinospora grovesii]